MSQTIFVVSTHGSTGVELVKTVEMLMGEQENLHSVSFVPGENTDTLVEKFTKIVEDNKGCSFIFFVDIWGGSPFNAANLVSSKFSNVNVLAGVNVPSLLVSLESRDDNKNVEEIIKDALDEGRKGIKSLKNNVEFVDSESSDDDSDVENKVGSNIIEKAEAGDHLVIAFTRIDDRLIHGQVATVWTKNYQVSRIIVVSDEVAKDSIRTSMLKQAAPPGVSAHVVDVAKASRVFNNPEYAGERALLLFTNPTEVLKLVEAGFDIKSVNIGGMAWKEGREMIDKSVSLDDKDIEAFTALDKLGVELEIRKVASDSKRYMMNEIRKLKK